jgi:hypothetical protein
VDQQALVEYLYRAVCEVLGGSPIGEVALRYGTTTTTTAAAAAATETTAAATAEQHHRNRRRRRDAFVWLRLYQRRW